MRALFCFERKEQKTQFVLMENAQWLLVFVKGDEPKVILGQKISLSAAHEAIKRAFSCERTCVQVMPYITAPLTFSVILQDRLTWKALFNSERHTQSHLKLALWI